MPKLSIIVTAYNIEKYIRQSLDSVLSQTLRDIEVIVVDDGSTDGTASIIHEYSEIDTRIKKILFEKNTIGGVATAANAGMDAATGDFIGFADGDDLYHPSMFARLYDAAVAHDADLAMCGYSLLDEETGRLNDPADVDRWAPYPNETALDLDDTTKREMLAFVSVPWRKIYRRDLVERIDLRFPVGDYFFEDNPFHWASIIGGERIVLIPEKLCQHRVARAGQTMATVDSRLLRIFRHHDNIKVWLRLHGYEQRYGNDLLRWTANQLSWVSRRAKGEILQELYDVLIPVIDQYDAKTIEEFGDTNGRGRTFMMLNSLKERDFLKFSQAATNGSQPNQVSVTGPSNSLVSRALFHLKHSGVRKTARMTARHLFARTGKEAFKSRTSPKPSLPRDRKKMTNDDLMAALAILQHEVRSLRDEIRSSPPKK